MSPKTLINEFKKKHPELNKDEIKKIISIFSSSIIDSIANGSRVEIRNFGTFEIKQTQRQFYRLRFRIGSKIQEKINEKFKKENNI
jgi:nucleoid DNA-binding protein